MQLVIYPAVEPNRYERIAAAAGPMSVINADSMAAAQAAMPRADAFFGKLTAPLLALAERLAWVQSPTASLEHYLFPELIEHPCVLTNMRGLYSDVIADHVLGFVICFARNFHRYVRQQAQGVWSPVGGEHQRSNFVSGPGTTSAIDHAHLHLADATMGIFGYGAIGREVGRRARGFGMHVLAIDPNPLDSDQSGIEAWPLDRMPELLRQSDFVVIAAPHTPQTQRLFDRSVLAHMKSTAYLINIGRGAIVVLADLVDALRTGRIAGAGLDVFETEPLPADHPLWHLDNVILTPHIAGTSVRIAERHLAVVVENVGRFVRRESLVNVVDKRQWF